MAAHVICIAVKSGMPKTRCLEDSRVAAIVPPPFQSCSV